MGALCPLLPSIAAMHGAPQGQQSCICCSGSMQCTRGCPSKPVLRCVCCAALCCAMLRCAVLRCAEFCYVYAVTCFAVLCYCATNDSRCYAAHSFAMPQCAAQLSAATENIGLAHHYLNAVALTHWSSCYSMLYWTFLPAGSESSRGWRGGPLEPHLISHHTVPHHAVRGGRHVQPPLLGQGGACHAGCICCALAC